MEMMKLNIQLFGGTCEIIASESNVNIENNGILLHKE